MHKLAKGDGARHIVGVDCNLLHGGSRGAVLVRTRAAGQQHQQRHGKHLLSQAEHLDCMAGAGVGMRRVALRNTQGMLAQALSADVRARTVTVVEADLAKLWRPSLFSPLARCVAGTALHAPVS